MEEKLPKLEKGNTTCKYKMQIPQDVESKIRYLQNKFPYEEWSGVLFFNYTGTFENNDLAIICKDIYPMDLGSAVYTTFRMTEDVAAYIANNCDKLWGCQIGLIHSHNTMPTFFSGTDLDTLQSWGNETNNFVSLIVNNAGKYTAAITRKIQRESVVREISSYRFFSEDADIPHNYDYQTKETVIQYFMLDIEKEEAVSAYSYLDKRFEEIAEQKRKRQENNKKISICPTSPSNSNQPGMQQAHIPDLFPEIQSQKNGTNKMELNSTGIDDKLIDKTLVRAWADKMLLCSMLVNSSRISMNRWITESMERAYDKFFGSAEEFMFSEYVDWVIDFIGTWFPAEGFSNPNIDDNTRLYLLYDALLEILQPYEGVNPYMDKYLFALETQLGNYDEIFEDYNENTNSMEVINCEK